MSDALLLAERGLTAVPVDLAEFTDLPVLDLGHNKLASVPDAIGELRELDFLYLHDNALTSIPALPQKLRYLNVDVRWVTIDDAVLDELEARGCLVYR